MSLNNRKQHFCIRVQFSEFIGCVPFRKMPIWVSSYLSYFILATIILHGCFASCVDSNKTMLRRSKFVAFDNAMYFYSALPTDFHDAKFQCNHISGSFDPRNHLAVITSDVEHDRLKTVFKGEETVENLPFIAFIISYIEV